MSTVSSQHALSQDIQTQQAQSKISSIDSQLEELGIIPLTIEDIYEIHGRTYRPGAPDVPSATNYVTFYGMTTYVGNYEVWSIVAYSKEFPVTSPPSKPVSVIMAKRDEFAVYPKGAYTESDFRKYFDFAMTTGEYVFKDTFEKIPILSHLSTILDVVDFFTPTPTTTQSTTCLYEAQQTFVYSYVAERDVGYFTFMQTGERIAGFFDISFKKYSGATPTKDGQITAHWEAFSDYYADYQHAVDLYKSGGLQYGYRVGSIPIVLRDNQNNKSVKHTIKMDYYNSIWNIPGV